jgi:hypothetical protein
VWSADLASRCIRPVERAGELLVTDERGDLVPGENLFQLDGWQFGIE